VSTALDSPLTAECSISATES